MEPVKETVWEGLNLFLYGNFLLLSSLEKAKPEYRTFTQLVGDTGIHVIPKLGYLLRLNTEAKTIKMEITSEGKPKGYKILPKGEGVLQIMKQYHETYDTEEVKKWLEEEFQSNVS